MLADSSANYSAAAHLPSQKTGRVYCLDAAIGHLVQPDGDAPFKEILHSK
jgi:hypothetical protein